MQFNNLKRNKANRKAKQVGRGGTRGKTSGKGTKGQNARSGRKKRPELRDFIKKLPKLRGRGKNFLKSRFEDAVVVKIADLEKTFSNGDLVNKQTLFDKGLAPKYNGKFRNIKILGSTNISKKLIIEGLEISKQAKDVVLKNGGEIK